MARWIWIILYTIVVHEPRVCHNHEQDHICKGQGPKNSQNPCQGYNSLLSCWIWIIREKKKEIWLSPMTKAPTPRGKSKKQRHNKRNAIKNLDYTTIADRLRTVSWSNCSHWPGVVKPVYERATFPLTATAVLSKGHIMTLTLKILKSYNDHFICSSVCLSTHSEDAITQTVFNWKASNLYTSKQKRIKKTRHMYIFWPNVIGHS